MHTCLQPCEFVPRKKYTENKRKIEKSGNGVECIADVLVIHSCSHAHEPPFLPFRVLLNVAAREALSVALRVVLTLTRLHTIATRFIQLSCELRLSNQFILHTALKPEARLPSQVRLSLAHKSTHTVHYIRFIVSVSLVYRKNPDFSNNNNTSVQNMRCLA